MVLLFSACGFRLLGEQLSCLADQGKSPHHTNGLKATRSAYYLLCSMLVDYVVCGMLLSL